MAESIAEKLYQVRKMQTPDEVYAFEEALKAVSSSKDPSILPDLFQVFDDSTEQPEVMWGLIHAVESYNRETYMRAMAAAIPSMVPHARDWLRTLHYGILNDDDARSTYRGVISKLPPETKQIVRQELEEVSHSEPEFSARIRDLLDEK